MGVQDYEALLRDVARMLGIDADGLVTRQALLSGNTVMNFSYLPRTELCRMAVVLAPPQESAAAYRWMLEANYDRSGIDLLPILALDPATERPSVFFHVRVGRPDAAAAIANLAVTGIPTFLLGWNDACAAADAHADPQHHLGALA